MELVRWICSSDRLNNAFPEGQTGQVSIEFGEDSGDAFTLTVRDDGVGLPEGLDWRDTESLGLQLVTALVDQLEGPIELSRNGGTEFRITFPERGLT